MRAILDFTSHEVLTQHSRGFGHGIARRVGVNVRVLLIEDEADLRTEIREYLQRRGHEVTDCGSLGDTRTAVQRLIAEAKPPEVIVCDVNLPDGNGVDFYIATSPGLPNCRWVLMSGAHDFEQLEKVSGRIDLPPCALVEKPVSMRTLNAALTQT